MALQNPEPTDRLIDYAGQLKLLAKRLEREGAMPDILRALRAIANELRRCGAVWKEVYHPGMLPVAVPPTVPYLPRRGLAVFAVEEPPRVAQFWAAYEALTEGIGGDLPEPLNHSTDATRIAISMPHFYEVWANSELPVIERPRLQAALKKSARRPLVGSNLLVRSRLVGKYIRCWVFEKP